MLKHDPIEEKEELKEIFEKVDKDVEKVLMEEGVGKGLGYIHIFDSYKKKLLKEKYGIEWKTTKEMNPGVLIDQGEKWEQMMIIKT